MAVHAAKANQFVRGAPKTMQSTVLPAPIGGVNSQINLAAEDPRYCVYAFNIVPAEYGMRTRNGYREWVINLETAPDQGQGVRTVAVLDPTFGNKAFAVTNEGIWDVTVSTDTPTRVQAFPDTSGRAGFAAFTQYVTDAGEAKILLTDEVNGYFIYDALTDAWAAGSVTGVDPADLVHVTVHKQRVWFTERNTANGWYLDVGAFQGPATKFTFGPKFRHGGELVGLYNWTLDSGAGVDDMLIAVSRGGDVIPYQGEDPSAAATWQSIGVFYVGAVPLGRRIASEYGGVVRILSEYGVTSISTLLAGGVQSTTDADSIEDNVSRLIRDDVNALSTQDSWEIISNPNDGTIIINTPERESTQQFLQFVLNVVVGGWGFWRNVPALTFTSWNEALMVGTKGNAVLRMDTPFEDRKFNETGDGEPVEFSLLHSFLHMNSPARVKYGQFIRPNYIGQFPISLSTRFLYDYDLGGLLSAPDNEPFVAASLWDIAIWDQNVWGSSEVTGGSVLGGSWGCGRTMAVALRGQAFGRITLVSTDVMWTVGHEFGPFAGR